MDGTIIRGITRAAGGPEGDRTLPPRDVVRAVIAAYLHLVEDDPEVYRFIVNAPILPPGRATRRRRRRRDDRPDRRARRRHRRRRARRGAVDAATAHLWGVALVGMVRAAADAWLADGGAESGRSADDLADALTTLAWDGLGAPRDPDRAPVDISGSPRNVDVGRGRQAARGRHFEATEGVDLSGVGPRRSGG